MSIPRQFGGAISRTQYLENGLDRETALPLEWYTGPLGHLHRVMQRPLYEWGNNRTPMRGRTTDIIDWIGRLRGGVSDLLQTLSVDGLST